MNIKEKSFDIFIFVDLIMSITCLAETVVAENLSTRLLMYQWLFVDIYCIARGFYIFRNILHPHFVFLGVINLFLCGRIFLDFIYDVPFYYTTYFTKYPFNVVVRNDMLLMLMLALLAANLGAMIGRRLWPEHRGVLQISKNGLFWSKLIMITTLIPVVVFYYQKYKLVSEYGYLILFAGQGDVGAVNVLKESPLIHFPVIWVLAFFVFLASKPQKVEFVFFSALYFCIGIFSMISGQRTEFATQLVVFCVYYATYIKKLSIKKVLTLFLSAIVAFSAIAAFRNSGNYESIDLKTEDMIQIFFTSQGVSINVLGYADQYKDNGGISDVFYPLDGYFRQKLDPDFRKQDAYFADKIAYQAQPSLYHLGRGLGSSYIAELYSAFSFPGVFIGGLLLSLFNLFIYNSSARNSLIGCFLLCIFWQKLAFMPRGPYLSFIVDFARFGLPLYIIMKMFKIPNRHRA